MHFASPREVWTGHWMSLWQSRVTGSVYTDRPCIDLATEQSAIATESERVRDQYQRAVVTLRVNLSFSILSHLQTFY